jgi:hypothetical protein
MNLAFSYNGEDYEEHDKISNEVFQRDFESKK